MAYTELEKLQALATEDLLCNTSYPYKPEYFRQYLFETDIMEGVDRLSFYFHIPFCIKLCSFCEYTRFILTSVDEEKHYLNLLEKQVCEYLDNHNINLLYGLDVGGGTPSALSESGLERLFRTTRKCSREKDKVPDYESSFEFSYDTINDDKIALIKEAKFGRVSTGIQIYDSRIMDRHNRKTVNLDRMMEVNGLFRKAGIKKINVDIMYGFPYQTDEMLESTVAAIAQLQVDHVTLYEMRYNQNNLIYNRITRKSLYSQYCRLYNSLTGLGYQARFGQNTFSKDCSDEGVSSYLRYRMRQAIPYKGFGISAQSMSMKGLSYNSLKGICRPHLPKIEKINEQYIYVLPKEELVGKYVSVAMYNGCFDLRVVSQILDAEAEQYYSVELEYLIDKQYITIDDEIVNLTVKGFEYYAVVAAFFWSKTHRAKYLKDRNIK